MAIPRREPELVAWSRVFGQQIQLDPGAFGLTQPLADAFVAAQLAFEEAYNAVGVSVAAGVRSVPLGRQKTTLKQTMLINARALYMIVQGTPGVTSAQKAGLGITIRKQGITRAARPTSTPRIHVESVSGNTVRLQFNNSATQAGVGRPAGVIGLYLLCAEGNEPPPLGTNGWRFVGGTGKSKYAVIFPGVQPGAKVWFTAQYFNTRKETGPLASPTYTYLPGGGVAMATELMRAA